MIKRLTLLIACFLFCAATSWAQEFMYEGENNGVLMLSVSEFNVKKNKAIEQAIKDSFFQVLFRGIPSSKEYKRPLLGTNENVKANYEYFNNMINDGRIYSFVNYSALCYYKNSALCYYKRREAVVKVSLNVRALEEDLERRNLYRRFGLY